MSILAKKILYSFFLSKIDQKYTKQVMSKACLNMIFAYQNPFCKFMDHPKKILI